ncbi:MAG: hypothetical protein ACKPKO_12770, partial [Candidatus Fonsibacter sp.]
ASASNDRNNDHNQSPVASVPDAVGGDALPLTVSVPDVVGGSDKALSDLPGGSVPDATGEGASPLTILVPHVVGGSSIDYEVLRLRGGGKSSEEEEGSDGERVAASARISSEYVDDEPDENTGRITGRPTGHGRRVRV